jgi:D-alanyl-D-alanine carboxypeptidase
LNYVCGKKASFPPTTKVEYSNTNTVLLALILDKLVGNHADVLTKELFQPLGLTHTFYKNEKDYPAPAGVVNTYIDMRGNGSLINSTVIERNFAQMNIGHDAMIASAFDYMTFMHSLFNEKIVNRTSLDTMMNMVVFPNNSNIKIGFGLGLEMIYAEKYQVMRAGHNGASLGAANNVFHYVEPNITIAICSNFGDFMPNPLGKLFYHWNIGTEGRVLGDIERVLLKPSSN